MLERAALDEPLVDQPDDGVVGHELAGVHVALGFEARRGALGRGRAEEIARGQVLDGIVLGKVRGLRALAGSLLAEQHQARTVRRSSRQARKPS